VRWGRREPAAEDAGDAARTVAELVAGYRTLVRDVEATLRSPTTAHRERSIERAIAFMREHLSEPLTLERCARAGGFAADYFSRLFKSREGKTFARFLGDMRIRHAQQMLRGTMLGVEQVRKMSGFRTRTSFYRAFKRVAGITPMQCRAEAVPRVAPTTGNDRGVS
jgi:transcriptional regulator GlxA family with amidase domain